VRHLKHSLLYVTSNILGWAARHESASLNISITRSSLPHSTRLQKDHILFFGVCLNKLTVTKLKHQLCLRKRTAHDDKFRFQRISKYHLNRFIDCPLSFGIYLVHYEWTMFGLLFEKWLLKNSFILLNLGSTLFD